MNSGKIVSLERGELEKKDHIRPPHYIKSGIRVLSCLSLSGPCEHFIPKEWNPEVTERATFPEDLESGLKPGSDFAPPGPKESLYTLFFASLKVKSNKVFTCLSFFLSSPREVKQPIALLYLLFIACKHPIWFQYVT